MIVLSGCGRSVPAMPVSVGVAPAELVALEVLAAAGGRVRAGTLEPLGLLLHEQGVLRNNNAITITPTNGVPTRSDRLIAALYEAVDQGHIRREGIEWMITATGERALGDSLPTAEATGAAERLRSLSARELSAMADRLRS